MRSSSAPPCVRGDRVYVATQPDQRPLIPCTKLNPWLGFGRGRPHHQAELGPPVRDREPQEGYFTTRQAAEAGYSSQLLLKHLRAGRVARAQRGIYRLVHFPVGEHEDLVTAWLWSERAGVISHQTALALHGLSDALPAQLHLTLPDAWRKRRFRVPAGIALHHADVSPEDRTGFGAVPATSAQRSLNDCAREGLSPDLLRQAARQAVRRGLVARTELGDVEEALTPFGGLAA